MRSMQEGAKQTTPMLSHKGKQTIQEYDRLRKDYFDQIQDNQLYPTVNAFAPTNKAKLKKVSSQLPAWLQSQKEQPRKKQPDSTVFQNYSTEAAYTHFIINRGYPQRAQPQDSPKVKNEQQEDPGYDQQFFQSRFEQVALSSQTLGAGHYKPHYMSVEKRSPAYDFGILKQSERPQFPNKYDVSNYQHDIKNSLHNCQKEHKQLPTIKKKKAKVLQKGNSTSTLQ